MHHWLCGLFIHQFDPKNNQTTYTRMQPHQCTDHVSSLDDVETYLLEYNKLIGLVGAADDLILECVRFLSLYVLHDLANVLYMSSVTKDNIQELSSSIFPSFAFTIATYYVSSIAAYRRMTYDVESHFADLYEYQVELKTYS
jgi:hypothetical protein